MVSFGITALQAGTGRDSVILLVSSYVAFVARRTFLFVELSFPETERSVELLVALVGC